VLKLVVRRVLLAIPLLLAVSFTMFVLMEFIPGDPAATIAGDQATESILDQIRDRLGLDAPIFQRYFEWLSGAIHGDLGTSLFNSQPVLESIKDRLPATLSLAFAGAVLAVAIGVPAGIIAAQRPGSLVDRAITAFTSIGLAVPSFWLGLILIVIFVHTLAWLPPTGYVPFVEDPAEWARSIAMPAIALGIPSSAVLARQTRSAMIDVLQQDYVRAARARGASKRGVLLHHGLKNAAAPIVTVLGFEVLAMLGGSIVIEQLFAVPGFGDLAFTAVQARDLTVIQGVVVVTALVVVVVNLVVDLLYAYANPRARPR
jgi:peptide/nickel transport system permease protein